MVLHLEVLPRPWDLDVHRGTVTKMPMKAELKQQLDELSWKFREVKVAAAERNEASNWEERSKQRVADLQGNVERHPAYNYL